MTFDVAWDETFPSDTQLASLGADDIRKLTKAIRERLAVDHRALAVEGSDARIGYHDKVRLIDQVNDLLAEAGVTICYAKSVGGVIELFIRLSDGQIIQLTSGGKLNGAVFANLANIPGAAGVIPSANIPNISGSKLTELTLIPASAGIIPDANLPPDADPPAFGAWVAKSNNTVYQAATDGFVVGWGGYSCGIYTDSNNPPTTLRSSNHDYAGGGGDYSHIFCPVRKNDYWKAVNVSSALFWLPFGS